MGCVALVCQWFGQTLFPSITQHTCHCSPWEKGAAGATTDYSIPSLKLNVFVVQKSYSDNYFSIWHAVCVQNKYQDMPDFAFRFNLDFLAAVLSRSQDRLKHVSLCTSMLTGGLFWLQGPRCWERMWISQQRQPLNAEGRKLKTEYDYSEPSFKHLLFSFCENTHTPISSIVSANIKNDTYRQTSQQKQTETQTKNSLQNITGISENVKRMRIRLWCSGSAILDHNTPSRR